MTCTYPFCAMSNNRVWAWLCVRPFCAVGVLCPVPRRVSLAPVWTAADQAELDRLLVRLRHKLEAAGEVVPAGL